MYKGTARWVRWSLLVVIILFQLLLIAVTVPKSVGMRYILIMGYLVIDVVLLLVWKPWRKE
jgi:hypothetical protein